jgi:hypothetical protein
MFLSYDTRKLGKIKLNLFFAMNKRGEPGIGDEFFIKTLGTGGAGKQVGPNLFFLFFSENILPIIGGIVHITRKNKRIDVAVRVKKIIVEDERGITLLAPALLILLRSGIGGHMVIDKTTQFSQITPTLGA